MSMEYLVVRFPGSRPVLIDGTVNGRTNHVLQLAAGTHTVSLAPPMDFAPPEGHEIELCGTNPLDPRVVRFAPAGSDEAPCEGDRGRGG